MRKDEIGGTSSTNGGHAVEVSRLKVNLKCRDNLGDLGIDGTIILRRILKKRITKLWSGL